MTQIQLCQLAKQGQEELFKSPEGFATWARKVIQDVGIRNWFYLLLLLGQISEEDLPDLGDVKSLSCFQASSLGLTYLLWHQDIEIVKSLFLPLTDGGEQDTDPIITLGIICSSLSQVARRCENIGELERAVSVRELLFELDPSQLENLLALVNLYLDKEDEGSAEIYTSLFLESILQVNKQNLYVKSPDFLSFLQPISLVFDKGYFLLAVQLLYGISSRLTKFEGLSFRAWVDVIALKKGEVVDSQADREVNINILNINIIGIFEMFFRDTQQYGYLMMADALKTLTLSLSSGTLVSCRLPTTVAYLQAAVNAAYYYSLAARNQDARDIIADLKHILPILDLIDPNQEILSLEYRKYTTQVVLFVFCFCLFYLEKDPMVLYGYQLPAASYFSYYTKLDHQELAVTSFDREEVNTSRPLRIGYLSLSFRRHSVGYLSHQIIGHHRIEHVHSYCYQYELAVDPRDNIYNDIKEKSYCFRDFSNLALVDIVSTIRRDSLDVLVYMDSLTSIMGCRLVALRLAPIQISWLGGDTPGLPEIDYIFVDQHLVSPRVNSVLSGKLIPLSVFTAVDTLEIDPVDSREFRRQIGATDATMLYWSAAIGHKRSIECIRAHVDVLSQVPDCLLVIKGAGDLRSVRDQYRSMAVERGVAHKLRFLAMSAKIESHRAQLGCADLILDTFPYTGATHTVEALAAGVPVLSQVGEHYYGRMGYSLLKAVGLESCIATTTLDYIEKAVCFGTNPQLLSEAKQIVIASKTTSPLWNARLLTYEMENIYLSLIREI